MNPRNPWEFDDEPDTSCIDCGEEGVHEIERIARSGRRERVWLCSSCYQLSDLEDPTDDGDAEYDASQEWKGVA